MEIRAYRPSDEAAVVSLWEECGLTRPWNDARKDIARGRGRGRALMERVEHLLQSLGCPKVNIQVRSSNTEALGFYRAIGYAQEEIISLGKRLIHDDGPGT